MPQQANLIIPDGQAAPVNHTFAAAGVSNGVALWLEKTSSIISGYFRLAIGMKLPAKSSDPVRHSLTLKLPTTATETINSVSRAITTRQSMVSLDIIIAPDATTQEKKDLMAYLWWQCNPAGTTTIANQVIYNDSTY